MAVTLRDSLQKLEGGSVICLNPSHGEAKPGYDYADVVGRDVAFLRARFPEIE